MPPKFVDMRMAVIELGETAEAALESTYGTIDSVIDSGNFLIADWGPGGKMAAEQGQIDHISIDLRGRDFRDPNRKTVPSRRASLDIGMDVIPRVKVIHW